jgi:hypothetical protein
MPKQNIIRRSTQLLLFLLLLIGLPGKSQAQSAMDSSKTGEQSKTASILSIEGGNKLMMEADRAIEEQKYDLAVEKLQNARQVYNQLSNFYLQLFNSFTGLDNATAEANRKKALDTSLERDKATYQLALVHRSQDKPELSVPLLIQIITSQSPGIGLGKKAYEQLLEIGFVDTPYTPPKPGAVNSSPPQAPPTPSTSQEGQVPSPEASPTAPAP